MHIEPHETFLQVRQRVDGLLRDVLTVPHHLQDQTISRLKIISGMDITERRKPQDGRSRLRFEGRRIDLRVSTLPTQFGEKVVIRLLNSERAILPLDEHRLRAGEPAIDAVVPGAPAGDDSGDGSDRQRKDLDALHLVELRSSRRPTTSSRWKTRSSSSSRASTRCRSTRRPA